MRKKLIIGGAVFVGFIVLTLILCFSVFTIKSVDIDFRTSLTMSWEEESIMESAELDYGRCLLFLSKKQYKDRVEKKNPYLEVINIETIFPSKLVFHVAERQELFAIKRETDVVKLDKDLKVLKIEDGEDYQSNEANPILLSGVTINKDFSEGDFLDIKEKGLKKFLPAMTEVSKTLNQTLGFCKSINLVEEKNYYLNQAEITMDITTFSDRKITIKNIDSNLNFKLQRVFQTLPMLYEKLVDNGTYTNEEVDRCSIVVGNQISNQNELYTHIYLDGEIITDSDK